MDTIDNILYPLQVVVAWVMVSFHSLLTALGLDADSGLSWALSIVGLVIIMRIILIPLFVKQIKASRGMQLLAPDMQKIQKKYKGKTDPASREAMSRETMELYRKHGTNPFSSCLPILAQSPIFFALFRVLYNMPRLAQEPGTPGAFPRDSIGPLDRELAREFTDATLFDARLSQWFLGPDSTMSVKVVAAILIVAMSATTFFTQRQLTQKNMPASALQGPMAQQQKMLLYLLPLIFLITGVNFPIGVLIYWTTTNVWSMGQQFYVIRRNPTPGSEAERALKERRARRAAARGIVLEEEEKPAVEEKPRGQRPQPKRKHRTKGTTPGAPSDGETSTGSEDGVDQDESAGSADGSPTARPTQRKTSGTKPTGAKPAGAKPAGGKPAGTRPAGGRPAGAKPAGGKPAGTKPAGSSPAGGKAAGTSSSPTKGTPTAKKASGSTAAGSSAPADRPTTGGAAADRAQRGGDVGSSATDGSSPSGADGSSAPRKARKPRSPRTPNA